MSALGCAQLLLAFSACVVSVQSWSISDLWTEPQQSSRIGVSDSRILYQGRFNGTEPGTCCIVLVTGANSIVPHLRPDPGAREFSWSGSQIYFRFKGTTVQAVVNPSVSSGGGGDRFGVLVDGQMHSTFQAKQSLATRVLPWCSRKDITFTLVSGLGDTEHTLVLWKLTEPGPANNRFGESAGNSVFKGLLVPSDTQLIQPPALQKRHLSDTAGYCADGRSTGIFHQTFSSEITVENNLETWSALIAHRFGARYSSQAVSGIGVMEQGSDPRDLSSFPLAALLGRTNPGQRNQFGCSSDSVPDAVVALIGPNDFTSDAKKKKAGGGAFEVAFKAMMSTLVGEYDCAKKKPRFIAVCAGSGNGFDPCNKTEAAIAGWDAGSTGMQAYYISMNRKTWDYINYGPKATMYQGCASHYNPRGHSILSSEVSPQIATILSWEGQGTYNWCDHDEGCKAWAGHQSHI